MPIDFSPYQAVLLDLDGTIYNENQPLPGAIELIRKLQNEKRNFACLSNSGSSPLSVMMRLSEMGVEIDPTNIYTAAAASCDYVIEKFPATAEHPRPRVFNLATESIDEMLQGLVDWTQSAKDACDAIIVAAPVGPFVTPERQHVALHLARAGAAVVGMCADRVYPSPRGLEFGAGSQAWMLAYAASVNPVFCGKPEPIFFHELCKRMNVDPAWCILIGDNLESDVAGGKNVGMRTVLTLGGVTRDADLVKLSADAKPDLVVNDLRELL